MQPYVTELDLRHSLIPDELIDDLVKTMPQHAGAAEQEEQGLAKFDYVEFMQKLMSSDTAAAQRNGYRLSQTA